MASLPEDITSQHQSSASVNSSRLKPIDDLLNVLLESKDVEPQDLAAETIEQPPLSTTDNSRDNSTYSNDQIKQNATLEPENEEAIDMVAPAATNQLPEMQVKIDSEIDPKKISLNEAVAYEAFLRQTAQDDNPLTVTKTNSEANTRAENTNLAVNQEPTSSPQQSSEPLLELQQTLTQKNYTVEDLAGAVNALIPLLVELLNYQVDDSRESILQAVTPVIDRIIEQRSNEDAQKMAMAIAKILPQAIATEISLSPQAIAKAIAPEIALAIREQNRLDEAAIAEALAPEMGKAIKNQIELEKDAMVDALYPVIGNTISKYMVEVVKEINRKVENTLSPEGIKRKIRAKLQGVSEAELILQEAVGYQVQAVFLIAKDSGLVIQEIQSGDTKHLESDLLAGMLTAIRSFANDCITSGSELDVIDYGDWQIGIEVAGYCYLAAVVKGEPSRKFRAKARDILSTIVLKYGDAIQHFDGNRATVPQGIKPLLAELVATDSLAKLETQQSQSSATFLWLLAVILGLILIPWGIIHYRRVVAQQIEQQAAISLDAAPELSVYRLEPTVSHGKLILTGRVPSPYLREQAAVVVKPIAAGRKLQLENQVHAVNVPLEPGAIAGEVQRLTAVLNRQDNVALNTVYQDQQLTITGFALDQKEWQQIYSTYQQIPGIEKLVMAVERDLPSLDSRFYFELGSAKLKENQETDRKIKAVQQFLQRYPQLNLRAIAHSDRYGSRARNQQLGEERVSTIQQAIIALGIAPTRLELQVSLQSPPEVTNNQPAWLSRCVRFEPFIPTN